MNRTQFRTRLSVGIHAVIAAAFLVVRHLRLHLVRLHSLGHRDRKRLASVLL
jgi:hypothetical protein